MQSRTEELIIHFAAYSHDGAYPDAYGLWLYGSKLNG